MKWNECLYLVADCACIHVLVHRFKNSNGFVRCGCCCWCNRILDLNRLTHSLNSLTNEQTNIYCVNEVVGRDLTESNTSFLCDDHDEDYEIQDGCWCFLYPFRIVFDSHLFIKRKKIRPNQISWLCGWSQ